MTPIGIFNCFKKAFPERVEHVVKYKMLLKVPNGIDIAFDDGSVLRFTVEKSGKWTLTGGDI